MPDALLEIHRLDAFYGDFRALQDISLEVLENEIVAIIGANGAGKSTFLKCVAGLLANEAEAIRYRGEAIGALGADKVAARGIALVPEGRRLFPSLSVEENLIIGGQLGRPGRWNLKRIYELFPVLAQRRDQPATSLSGGQQQMVAISRALMLNPDFIMFDEISLGLAPVVIKDIYEALPAVISQGTSAVIVEQDISRALAIADRFICFQEGRISLAGRPGEHDRAAISAAYFGL